MFVNPDNNEPYWTFENLPIVTDNLVLLSQPPNNLWSSPSEVKVIPKLEWFVLSKTYPKAEFTFYNPSDRSEYTVVADYVNLDNPGTGLWANRN